jgi:hypothetical protein
MPSKEELDVVLKYDPDTGDLTWRVRPVTLFNVGKTAKRPRSAEHACNQWNSRWAGKPGSTLKPDGYRYVHFNYRTDLAHRVIWKIMTGEDPIEIDHIDGKRSNNKWSNLRNGTRTDNFRNLALKRNNTSGYHGVSFSKRQQKWIASIWLGTFYSKEEAIETRKKYEVLLGFHPNHGKKAVTQDKPVGRDISFNSKSSVAGVTWDAERDCWQAWISANGKQNFLGRFLTKDAAISARKDAEIEYRGRSTA